MEISGGHAPRGNLFASLQDPGSIHYSAPKPAQRALKSLIRQGGLYCVSTFKVHEDIPHPLRAALYKDMDTCITKLAVDLADEAGRYGVEAFDGMLHSAADVVARQANRLSGVVKAHDFTFREYLTLLGNEKTGQSRYLFVSGESDSTCDLCASLNGGVFTLGELSARSAIPPLHPNCRCKLVALDGLGELVYNVGREAFLDEAGAALNGQGGSLFALAHDGFRSRLSPASFQPLKTQAAPAITGEDASDETLWDSITAWGKKFGQDAAAAFRAAVDDAVGRGQSVEDALYDIYLAVSSGNLLDVLESLTKALPKLIDWLSLGLISGYFEQNQSNFRQWILDQTDYS